LIEIRLNIKRVLRKMREDYLNPEGCCSISSRLGEKEITTSNRERERERMKVDQNRSYGEREREREILFWYV